VSDLTITDRALRRGRVALPVLVLYALPFYLDAFWLRIGLFSMAAAIGAVGLGLLTGTAGQLSLGHAFSIHSPGHGGWLRRV
jgi:branched-chain amino acid transport system permease protein